MKKLIIIFVISLIGLTSFFQTSHKAAAQAGARFTVKLTKCVDGDTAWFSKVGKTRFLYIDTPESTNRIEPFGKEASIYTCNALKSAKTIQLQFDGHLKDKYNRTLAWVWVNGRLLQKDLITKGFVKQFYDYGTYSYENELKILQVKAQKNKVGLWKGKVATTKTSHIVATDTSTSSGKAEFFKNCTELRMKYPNGVPKGHPAYQAKLDRDKDNFACEK
ncbi:MAG: thermonuclease family protein [Bacillota bacterium]|nr:thermonuclease family protein [Bacillota bacterium]